MWIINPREDYHFDPSGRIHSDPSLTYGTSPNPAGWSGIIPSAWFLQKNDDVHHALMEEGTEFHIMGGNVGKLHDRRTTPSLPPGPRGAYGKPHSGAVICSG